LTYYSRLYFMLGLIIVGSIYFILLDFLSFIFSIRLCGTISSSTSTNFKCGFYSIVIDMLVSVIFIPILNLLCLLRPIVPYIWINLCDCVWFCYCYSNPINKQTVNKVYLVYFLVMNNLVVGFLWFSIIYLVDIYIAELVNMRLNYISLFMVLVVLLVSSCVILCSIDYLTIVDSYNFIWLLYIFQLIMIIFVLSNVNSTRSR